MGRLRLILASALVVVGVSCVVAGTAVLAGWAGGLIAGGLCLVAVGLSIDVDR